jgi:MYXO-CTERM domain-containing protein
MRRNLQARWLVVCVVLWSSTALAAPVATMNPATIDVGAAAIGSMVSGTGMLSANETTKVSLVLGTCSGGGGTFAFSPSTGIDIGTTAVAITVSYTPSANGTRSCAVDIRHHADCMTFGTFTVRGTGGDPPTISVMNPSNFGSVRFNDAAPNSTSQLSIPVTNTGDQTLNVTNVTFAGMHPGDFSIVTGGTSGSITADNIRTWTVRFNPSAAGARSATMIFESNDPVTPTKTINLAGTGTTAVISVGATTSFGIVSVGSQRSEDVTIANIGGTPRGTLGVTRAVITGGDGWFSFSGCSGATTDCTFSPRLAVDGATVVVGVRCVPPIDAGTSTKQARVTFTSDSDSGTANFSDLSCTAGSSQLTVSTAELDFGPRLVTDDVTLTLMVRNTGNVATTATFSKSGSHAARYTVTTPASCGLGTSAPCALAADTGTVTATIEFSPRAEGDLAANLDIVSPGGNRSVTLLGRGIDRHIRIAESLQFPDTYRNPGSMAPQIPVIVENTGEAPLEVTNLEILGDPDIWSLVTPFDKFTIPGLESHAVLVQFSPLHAGKLDDAVMRITSTDRTFPMKSMFLSGNGKDRNVSVLPGSIDVGDTFAGVPTRLSLTRDELVSINNNDEADFTIRGMDFGGPDASAFALVKVGGGAVAGSTLSIGASQQYDIVFSPTHVGEFEASLMLYLDEDPVAQRPVPVRGRALFVSAYGSGGCASGRGPGPLALVAIVLVFARRRRRR